MTAAVDTSRPAPTTSEPRSQRGLAWADRPSRRQRLLSPRLLQIGAMALCGLLLLGFSSSFVLLVHSGGFGFKQTDFVAYYSASRLVLEGHAAWLYDFHALGGFESHLVYPLQVRDGVLPYVYPPYLALLLAPLAALPYTVAFAVWLLFNAALLVAVTAALQRYARLHRRGAILLWLASFSFLPVIVALAQGQTSLLLLALLVLAVFALRSGHDTLAGAALALALVKPQFVVPFVVTLALQRRWRALSDFAVASATLVIGPALALGVSPSWSYVQTLLRAGNWHSQFGYAPQLNQSFAGLAQLLLPPAASTPATVLVALAGLALLAATALRTRQIDVPLAVGVVVALLVSPHVLLHDLSLLLLPVGVALRHRQRAPGQLALLLVLGYLTILAGLRLVEVAPLQISALAMSALGLWLASPALPHPCALRRNIDARQKV